MCQSEDQAFIGYGLISDGRWRNGRAYDGCLLAACSRCQIYRLISMPHTVFVHPALICWMECVSRKMKRTCSIHGL